MLSALANESAFYSTDAWLGSSMLVLGLVLGVAIAFRWRRHRLARGVSQLLPSELVTMLAHDMRTPLKGILGYIELLRDQPHIERDDVDALQQSAHELDLMLEAVLEYARSSAKALPVHNAPFAFEDIIDEALAGLRPALRRKRLDLTVGLDPELPTLLVGDAYRVKQLLANLLSNAIKYTPDGSIALAVTVVARDRDRDPGEVKIELEVRDTGPGFTSAARQLLFQPFSAVEHHALGSSGLGLALVKRLVESMAGDVTVDEQRDHGAAVRIRLPLGRGDDLPAAEGLLGRRIGLCEPHLPTRVAITRMLEGFGAHVSVYDDEGSSLDTSAVDACIVSASVKQPPAASAPVLAIRRPGQPSPEGPCIEAPVLPGMLYRELVTMVSENIRSPVWRGRCLIVDDNPLSLEHSRSILTQSGWSAWTAIDGRHALRLLRERRIDTMFLDLHLPDLDAEKVVREARVHAVRTVIGLSADPADGARMGVDFSIHKPLRIAALDVALLGEPQTGPLPDLHELAASTLPADLRELRDALQRSDRARADAVCHRLEGALRTLEVDDVTTLLAALRDDLRDALPWQHRFDALESAMTAYLSR
ncbi:MAG: hybrid sensor histidine kinase/response regulator [Pseudomonadales bacterium]